MTKFTFAASELRAALVAVEPAISRRPATAAQACVRVDGRSVAAAGDVIRIEVMVADVEPVEPVLLNLEQLHAVCWSLHPDDEVSITVNPSGAAVIRAPGNRWIIPTVDASLFPARVGQGGMLPVLRLPGDQFSGMLQVVAPAVRWPGSPGMLLDVRSLPGSEAATVAVVATNGKAMHKASAEFDQAVDSVRVVVPPAAVPPIQRAAAAAAGSPVQVLTTKGKNVVVVITDTMLIETAVVAAKFPKWESLARSGRPAAAANVAACDLMRATIAAKAVATPDSSSVRYEVDGSGQLVRLSKKSPAGESRASCQCTGSRGDGAAVLNPSYVSEFLRTVPGTERIEVAFGGGDDPVVLSCDRGMAVIAQMVEE